MSTQWYALRSHPHKEDQLYNQLISRQIEAFYPCIRVNPVNPRARRIRAYFPGYLFVHVDLDAVGISAFQWMPYAVGLLTFGEDPSHVPDALIAAIQRRVAEINTAGGEVFTELSPGAEVWIHSGPFAGYSAIFDARLPGTERVRVLLKMLSRGALPLEMDASQLVPQRKAGRKHQ